MAAPWCIALSDGTERARSWARGRCLNLPKLLQMRAHLDNVGQSVIWCLVMANTHVVNYAQFCSWLCWSIVVNHGDAVVHTLLTTDSVSPRAAAPPAPARAPPPPRHSPWVLCGTANWNHWSKALAANVPGLRTWRPTVRGAGLLAGRGLRS